MKMKRVNAHIYIISTYDHCIYTDYTVSAYASIVYIPITQCQHMRALYIYRLHSVSTYEHCIYTDYTVPAHVTIVSIPITQCQHIRALYLYR